MLGLELVVRREEAVELVELEGDDDPFEEVIDTALMELDCAEGMFELVTDEFAGDDGPGILVEPEADIKDGISGGWG